MCLFDHLIPVRGEVEGLEVCGEGCVHIQILGAMIWCVWLCLRINMKQ